MSGFTFDGIHSKAKYITAIRAPRAIVPQRKTEIVEIPFRTLPYVIPDESYKSENILITCWLDTEGKSLYEVGREWTGWLHTTSWGNLIFDDDPNFVYKAICITTITPDDLRSPIVNLEFICAWSEVIV